MLRLCATARVGRWCSTCAFGVLKIPYVGSRPASVGQPGTKRTCRHCAPGLVSEESEVIYSQIALTASAFKDLCSSCSDCPSALDMSVSSSGQTCSRWLCYGLYMLTALTSLGQHFSAHLVLDDSSLSSSADAKCRGKRYCVSTQMARKPPPVEISVTKGLYDGGRSSDPERIALASSS